MCVFVSVHMCVCLHTCVAHISPTWGGVGELFLVVTANVIKELVFHKCHHKSTQRAIVPAAGGTEEEDKGEKGRLQLPDECLQCILYRPQQTDDNYSGFSCGNHQPKVFFEIPLYCTMIQYNGISKKTFGWWFPLENPEWCNPAGQASSTRQKLL